MTAHLTSQIADVSRREPTRYAWHLEVVARGDLQRCPHWRIAFANERKDHRYYELVEDTLHPEFDYRYFVIKDTVGQVCAVQPFFLLDLDLLVGASPLSQSSGHASSAKRASPMRTRRVTGPKADSGA
jgi:hypothetical protein